MDETVEVKMPACPWPVEQIEGESFLYRQIPVHARVTSRGKKFPGEGHFELRDGEESLSFNWNKHIDVPKNYILLGLTFNINDLYLEYTGYKIFKYPVSFLKALPKFISLDHTPNYYGSPSPNGKPNNRAHSSLDCGIFDDGTRVALSDYCIENIEESECNFKIKAIKGEIEELRARANDTPYHKEWDFAE